MSQAGGTGSPGDWWAFRPADDVGPSVIGLSDWLEKPAGKRGFVQIKGDQFAFADGTVIKFWGTNHNWTDAAPDKKTAEFRAKRYAKYGVNCVRMHKFTGKGWEGIGSANDSTVLSPGGLDRLDYYSDQLRRQGVYHGWSPIYGHKLRPGDRAHVKAYDEVMRGGGGKTYGLVNFAPDLQDRSIKMVVNLLNHRNSYSGMRHADDPSLAYVELQNEDDIFWLSPRETLSGKSLVHTGDGQTFLGVPAKKYWNQQGASNRSAPPRWILVLAAFSSLGGQLPAAFAQHSEWGSAIDPRTPSGSGDGAHEPFLAYSHCIRCYVVHLCGRQLRQRWNRTGSRTRSHGSLWEWQNRVDLRPQ